MPGTLRERWASALQLCFLRGWNLEVHILSPRVHDGGLHRRANARRMKVGMAALLDCHSSVCVNLGVWLFSKYFNFYFFRLRVSGLARYRPSVNTLNLILPVGISFYTFHSMSYTIDVYREAAPRFEFCRSCAVVSFFPPLVADDCPCSVLSAAAGVARKFSNVDCAARYFIPGGIH